MYIFSTNSTVKERDLEKGHTEKASEKSHEKSHEKAHDDSKKKRSAPVAFLRYVCYFVIIAHTRVCAHHTYTHILSHSSY